MTITSAPGTVAPDLSCSVPSSAPVAPPCAKQSAHVPKKAKTRMANRFMDPNLPFEGRSLKLPQEMSVGRSCSDSRCPKTYTSRFWHVKVMFPVCSRYTPNAPRSCQNSVKPRHCQPPSLKKVRCHSEGFSRISLFACVFDLGVSAGDPHAGVSV